MIRDRKIKFSYQIYLSMTISIFIGWITLCLREPQNVNVKALVWLHQELCDGNSV